MVIFSFAKIHIFPKLRKKSYFLPKNFTYQEYRERELAKRKKLHAEERKKQREREKERARNKREAHMRVFMEHEMEFRRELAEKKEAKEKERLRLMRRLAERRKMFKMRRRKKQREWYAMYRIKQRILAGKEVFYTPKEKKPRTVYNIYKYRIVVTRDKRKSRVIMSSNDLEQIAKRFDEILQSNKAEGLCYKGHPLYSDKNSYEVLMVQRNAGDPNDDGVRYFRNRYGIYTPAITEENKYTILRKEEWRVPITFKFKTKDSTVTGVTCRDLMDKVFSCAVSNDTMITVFLDSTKLYLDNGDFLACVQAKTRADAFQLYTTLVEENVKNKYVVFAGRYRKDISFLAERLKIFS